MWEKANISVFLTGMVLSMPLFSIEPFTMVQSIATKLIASCFPFFRVMTAIAEMAEGQWVGAIILLVVPFILELYIIHQMLKASYEIIAFRLLIIGVVQFVMQKIIFVFLTICFLMLYAVKFGAAFGNFNIKTMTVLQKNELFLWPVAILGCICTFFLLISHVMIAYRVYGWLDKAVDRKQLKKTMLYANLASYISALIFIMSL